MKRYVDVIVPLPIAGQYTYAVPSGADRFGSFKDGMQVFR